MHEHRFVNALAELGEEFGAGFARGPVARGAQQQLVDRHAERLHVELGLVFRIDFDALRQTLAADRALNRAATTRRSPADRAAET